MIFSISHRLDGLKDGLNGFFNFPRTTLLDGISGSHGLDGLLDGFNGVMFGWIVVGELQAGVISPI